MKFRAFVPAIVPLLTLLLLQACDTGNATGTSSAYALSDGSTVETAGTAYSSSTSDVPAVYVTNGVLTLNTPTVTKSGDESTSGASSKTGVNAAVRASSSSARITVNGGTIQSGAKGGNGAFAYNGSTVSLSGVTVTCTGSSECRGIDATSGGIIAAVNLTASTTGSNSSVVATDQGGGTITLTGGSFSATGTDSAGIYSTGTISGSGLSASSSAGEACVIEGSNSITLTDSCTLTSGAANRGILILQSGSGDATGYNGKFTMTGGSITTT